MNEAQSIGLATAAIGAVIGFLEWWRNRGRDRKDAGSALLDDYQVALAAERTAATVERQGRLAADERAAQWQERYLEVQGTVGQLRLQISQLGNEIRALKAHIERLGGSA